MTAVTFYFQVHQPYRLYRPGPKGKTPRRPGDLFDRKENERICRRVAARGYARTNRILLRAIDETEGAFRCAFSISGTALRQLEEWAPEALDTFVQLAETGAVEFLAETSMHSLACFGDAREFEAQIRAHQDRVEALFGRRPTTFRNTECILSEPIARTAERLGFQAILGEGIETLLKGRNPHELWRPRGCERIVTLLRDYRFSDDIAFRFSNREWEHYPIDAKRFADWLRAVPSSDPFVGLFMDYETFGEHQGDDTGILDFLTWLPRHVLEDDDRDPEDRVTFATPHEVTTRFAPLGELKIDRPVSWADAERDVSAWLGNPMQNDAHKALYAALPKLQSDTALLDAWRLLSTSDHVYYMCTKRRSDGDVHDYFSPYFGPHDAYVLFVRAIEALCGLGGV
ncbi:MAG: alpha-amylase [Planctomycetes bacterium]|nr:alpha-amylase [Planctomycetota bacterium]